MPMVMARADAFGLSGREQDQLDANKDFRAWKRAPEAGVLMGMGDVSKSVTPKFGRSPLQ